jgi:hypothetical protein
LSQKETAERQKAALELVLQSEDLEEKEDTGFSLKQLEKQFKEQKSGKKKKTKRGKGDDDDSKEDVVADSSFAVDVTGM